MKKNLNKRNLIDLFLDIGVYISIATFILFVFCLIEYAL